MPPPPPSKPPEPAKQHAAPGRRVPERPAAAYELGTGFSPQERDGTDDTRVPADRGLRATVVRDIERNDVSVTFSSDSAPAPGDLESP
jgi:hypothetical protein